MSNYSLDELIDTTTNDTLNDIVIDICDNALESEENTILRDIFNDMLKDVPTMDVTNMIFVILNYIYSIDISESYIYDRITKKAEELCCVIQKRSGVMHGLAKAFYVSNNKICMEGRYEDDTIVEIVKYDTNGDVI